MTRLEGAAWTLFHEPEPLGVPAHVGIATAVAGRAEQIQALVPLMKELAVKAGDAGVTVHDLRIVAVQRGLLPAASRGRELSFLSAVPKAAGLTPTAQLRRSPIPASHANLGRIWCR